MQNQTNKYKVAKIISIIGHPLLTITVYVLIAMFSGGNMKSAFFISGLIVGCILLPITAIMYVKSKNGSYTNFDVSDRKQRHSLFLYAIPLFVTVTIVMFLTHQPGNICISLLFATLLSVVSQVVNRYIKSSLHVSLNLFLAFMALPVAPVFGVFMFPASFIIGWSRLELKRHTLKEVIIGAAIGIIIGSLLLYFVTLGK